MKNTVSYKRRETHGSKKPLKKWQKGLIITVIALLTVLVILLITTGGVLNSMIKGMKRDKDFNSVKKEDLGIEYVIDKNVYNIALFGIDTRTVGDFSGNSDSIMILSLNKSENKIRLVSIMRDSFVPIEKKNKTVYGKINSAYADGGPALAVKTLNQCFGLDISEYATVNFFGMIDIIDAVGGIDCHVTEDELHCKININSHITGECESEGIDPAPHLIHQSGCLHLNGIQAVAYARIRYASNWLGTSNDFGRTERQRYVMQQLLDKALKMEVTAYPALVKKLAPFVKTSFNNSQLLNLAAFLVKKPKMETSRVPSDEYIINSDFRPKGGSSVYYNYKYAGKVLRAFLYDGITPESYMAENGIDKSGWYGVSKPNKVSSSTAVSDVPVVSSEAPSEPVSSAEPVESAEPVISDEPAETEETE